MKKWSRFYVKLRGWGRGEVRGEEVRKEGEEGATELMEDIKLKYPAQLN